MNPPNSKIDFHEINKSQYNSQKLQIGNFCDNEHIKEIKPLTISKMEKQAQSVACLILSQNLEKLKSGNYRLCNTVTLAKKIETKIKDQQEQGFEVIGAKESNIESSKKEIPFGEKEAFGDELAPGYGTAFFIGKRFALTAAHCVCLLNSDCLDTDRIEKTQLVFNFKKIQKNKPIFNLFTKEKTEVTFDESDVFGIKRVVCHNFSKKERKWADWALLELDREVTGREPLEISYAHISEAQMTAKKMKLYMLGHPNGLSIKLTKDGIVTETKQPGYFSCHLDAFSGNSGSPVFDFEKQKIIGILTAGGEDYEITNNYRNTKKTRIQAHCVTNGHEKCQRMSSLLIELERNGALNERPLPENEIENFLIVLKNNYKRQKNILRLLHKDPLPINVVYTQLVLLQNISKKIKDEKINTDYKNKIKTTIDKNFKQIYKERGISSWEDIRTSKKPIDLEKLFEKSENQNSAPKQLLIMGKAGVGKSTLCQHIAFQWAHGKLWNEKFDALFWVPLRKLQEIEPNETVSSFLFRSCCLGNHELYPCEIMDYIKNNQDKILFVLDGYDEFDPLNQAQKEIVDQLQKHPYWILTSRPYAAQAIKADAKIENVGFTSETIEQYIYNALPLKQKERAGLIIQKIRQNPIVFGLCHIPINLELVFTILETMDEKKDSPFSIHSMTDLYALLTCTLQRRFLMRILGENILKVNNETIDEQIKYDKDISCVFEFLEATAWIGLKNKELEFSYNEGVLNNLYLKFRPQKTSEQEQFRKYFKECGFIQSIGKNSSFTECKFSFIHLTFQEFFAARYLVSLLKSEENKSVGEKLIKEIKFNPRYLIVMWFIAGLLKNDKEHLNHFFELLGHPKEMAGPYPALLKVRCLEECGWTKKITKIKKYEKEILFWCNQMKNPLVGRIIEQFIVETFEISPLSTKRLLSPVLEWMCQKSEFSIFMYYSSIYFLAKPKRIIPMLIQNLNDENSEWTINVLSQMGRKDIERFLPLIKEALENSGASRKKYLIKALAEVGQTHLQRVLPFLKESLNDVVRKIRVETIQALGSLEKIDPKIIYPLLKEVLKEDFEKKDHELIYTTIKALCETTQVNSSDFFSFIEKKILENEDLKIAGVHALGYMNKEEAFLPLKKILTEPIIDHTIKEEIPLALARIGRKNPTFAFNLLKIYIENESNSELHFGILSAIEALGEIGHIHPTESLDLLAKFLEDTYMQFFNEFDEDSHPKKNINEKRNEKFIENKIQNNLKNINDFFLIAKLIETLPSLSVMLTVTAIGKIASKDPERAIELLKKALLFNTKPICRRVFITFGRIAHAAPLFRASLIELLEEKFININLEDDIRGGAAIGLALACNDTPKIIAPLFEKIFIQKNSKFLIKDLFNALSLFEGVDLQFAHSFMISQNLKNPSHYTLAEQMDWSLHPKDIKKLAIAINKTKKIKKIKFGSTSNKKEKKELTKQKKIENFTEITNIDEKTPLLINTIDTLQPLPKIDTERGEIAENDSMLEESYPTYIVITPHKNLLSRTSLNSLIENYCQQSLDKSDYIYPIILKCLEENTVIFFEDNALCFYEKDKIHRINKFCDLPLFKNSLKEKLSEESENSQDIPLIEKNIDQSLDDEKSISTAKDHLSFIHEEMYSSFSQEMNYDKKAQIILKSSPIEAEDMINYNPKPIHIDCGSCCKIL